MGLIDLITFLVMMLLLIFLFFRRAAEEKRRKEHPEEYEKEQQQALKELMRSLNIKYTEDEEIEEEVESLPVTPPPPPVKPKSVKPISKNLEKHELRESFLEPFRDPYEDRSVKIGKMKDAYSIKSEKSSRATDVLNKLKSPKEMIILREVLDKPIALRQNGFSDERV